MDGNNNIAATEGKSENNAAAHAWVRTISSVHVKVIMFFVKIIITEQRRLEALVCARDCRLLLCARDFEYA